jgi:putative membrane protein
MKRATVAQKLAPAFASCALIVSLAPAAHAGSEPAPVVAAGSILLAQTPPPAGATGSSATAPAKARNPDQKFVESAAEGGMAEVDAGKMAASQASAASVKSFAEQMVADHTKANDQLKQLAATKGITLPTKPDRSHVRQMEKMGKLQGAEFDREYMKLMVADHKKTVSLFEKQAKSGKDPELKNYATTLLPDLQKHLKMAQSTEQELKKSSAAVDERQRSATMK